MRRNRAAVSVARNRAVDLLLRHRRLLVWRLGAFAALLVLLNIAAHLFTLITGHDHVRGLIPMFDLDMEANVPATFGALLLLLAAGLVALHALGEHLRDGRDRYRWTLLAVVLLAMTVDEVIGLHERLTEPVRALLGADSPRLLHFAWVVPGAAFVAALAWSFRGFLQRLPGLVRPRVYLAAALFVGGALGVEMLGGYYAALHSTGTFFYKAVLVSIEEGLEMAGMLVFVDAMLAQLGHAAVEAPVIVPARPVLAEGAAVAGIEPGSHGPLDA
jgi:uncharacterized membrane protein